MVEYEDQACLTAVSIIRVDARGCTKWFAKLKLKGRVQLAARSDAQLLGVVRLKDQMSESSSSSICARIVGPLKIPPVDTFGRSNQEEIDA